MRQFPAYFCPLLHADLCRPLVSHSISYVHLLVLLKDDFWGRLGFDWKCCRLIAAKESISASFIHRLFSSSHGKAHYWQKRTNRHTLGQPPHWIWEIVAQTSSSVFGFNFSLSFASEVIYAQSRYLARRQPLFVFQGFNGLTWYVLGRANVS